jgi:quercetin 2,3-dioxygenase
MEPMIREVKQIIDPQFVIEGAGVLLRRSVSPSRANPLDPFLLFDHFAFNDPVEGPIKGFPTHPHRGIETVTYILEGSVRHRDSIGNLGVIGPGDVQWMTSGRGILHEEMPQRGESGRIDGFQLWVNLPAVHKMDAPRYQEVNAKNIPVVLFPGGRVRLVAGEFKGVLGPVTDITAGPLYMEVQLDPNGFFSTKVPLGYTTAAYLFAGQACFGSTTNEIIDAVRMIVFEDGDLLNVAAGEQGARFMLVAGAPFGEPIVPYGPFVMNTVEEIQQALADLRAGTFVK